MKEFVSFTVDMGTSGWKIKHLNQSFYLSSLVASGPIREQVNGVFETDYSNKSLDNISLTTDLGTFFVGNIAKNSETPPWSGFGKERYGTPEFMIPMTLAAMSEAKVRDGEDLVILTTAVPAKWIESEIFVDGRNVPITDLITDHFMGEHVIDRVGQRGQRVVTVTDVKVLTETKGLLYSFLLDKYGKQTVNDFENMRFVVADIGELTTCLDMFLGLGRERESVTLTDVSMGQVHKATADQIYEDTARSIEPREVRDIIQAHEGYIMLPATKKRNAIQFDIMPIYQEKITLSQRVFRSHFGDFVTKPDDVHHMIIGGGGSETIGPALQYQQADIYGQFATAQGLSNYGELLCQHMNKR